MSNFSYNPGVVDRRGEYIAQGISSAGRSISGGLEQLNQQREESKVLAAQSKAYETLLPQYAQAAGVDPMQIDALLAPSADESPKARNARLAAAMQGIVGTQALKAKALQDEQLKTLIAGEKQRQDEIARQRLQGDAQTGRMRAMFGGQPSGDQLGAMLQDGGTFQNTMPAGGPPATSSDAVQQALAAGIDQPRLIDAIGRYAGPRDNQPWQPSIVDLGGGRQGMMTSPRSAVPVKPDDAKAAYQNGPVLSPDKQYYQTGPNEPWKPVPKTAPGAKLDPMLVGTINEQITKLEAEKLEQQQAIASGDNRFGFANINSRADRLQEIDSRLAGLRATLKAGNAGAPGSAPTAPPAPTAPRFKILQVN